MLTLADLYAALGQPIKIPNAGAIHIREVVIDSRQVKLGDLFVALPGEAVDGHRFVADAVRRGAIAALVQQEVTDVNATPDTLPVLIRVNNTLVALQQIAAWWRDQFNVRVIGVTGSVGKTTTKEIVAQVLSMRYNVLKNEGNLNNEIGLPLTLLKLRPEHQRAVLEMAMYTFGEIALLAQIAKPVVGVVTMVRAVHIERMGSLDNIAKAKSELIEALPSDGIAILNDDDERVRNMAKVSRAHVMTYGLSPRANIWADNIETYGLDGISLDLCESVAGITTRHHARVPLLGRHSAQTVLRAAAVGRAEGMPWGEIIEGLVRRTTQLRLVTVEGPHSSVILDDTYNATTESVIAALNLLAEMNDGPRIAVLGDMFELGDIEEQEHRLVGCRAALVAQKLVCVGERARWIADEAIACGAQRQNVIHVMTNAQALQALTQIVTERSTILVKGSRGMKMEELVSELSKN
ncbi:MAG: UDP-N-acetylmuramoyl-tripeptide--D-alanyl-D-alanine ligase [Chloroflexota bacterium]